MELKSVGDHLLIPVTLQTQGYENRHHVLIDLAADETFAAFGQLLYAIPYGDGETTLKMLGPNFRLELPRRHLVGVPASSRAVLLPQILTSEHDNELGNVDVLGIMGLSALQEYRIEIDPVRGTLTLAPSREGDLARARERYAQVVTGVERARGGLYVPISYGEGRTAYMALNTAGYDTYVDAGDARSRDLGNIAFGVDGGGYSITKMAALFPRDFAELDRKDGRGELAKYMEAVRADVAGRMAKGEKPPDNAPMLDPPPAPFEGHVLLRSGLSLLTGYRIEINPSRGYIALTQVKDSNYDEADAAYYAAASGERVDALQAYMRAYPEGRHVRAAVDDLFFLALSRGLDDAVVLDAVRRGTAVVPENRKAAYAMRYASRIQGDEKLRESRARLLISLAEFGMESVAVSLSPGMRQDFQMMIGDRYLALGDARQAWKYFLSAAFNRDPRSDAIIRYDLGRAYEAMGRYRRAYSSYQRSLTANVPLPPQWLDRAQAALARVRGHLAPGDPLLAEGVPAPAPTSDAEAPDAF